MYISEPNRKIQLDRIHEDLRQFNSWVGWRYLNVDGRATKVPFDLVRGGNASSTDDRTWCNFQTAKRELSNKPAIDGLGIILVDDLVGIDLDDCFDPDDPEELKPWAQGIVSHLASYTEVSPSGKGIRIFCRGHLPPGGRKASKPKVEMYDSSRGRYLTVTGNVHRHGPIAERSERLAEIHRAVFLPTPRDRAVQANEQSLERIRQVDAADRIRLARRFLAKRPGATAGRDASGYCYALAVAIVWGFGLDEEDAVEVMHEWGQRPDQVDANGWHYPWTLQQIRHKIRSATKAIYKDRPGNLLVAEYREELSELNVVASHIVERSE